VTIYLPGYHVGAYDATPPAIVPPCSVSYVERNDSCWPPGERAHVNRAQGCFGAYYGSDGSCAGTELEVPNAQGLPAPNLVPQSSILYTSVFTAVQGLKVYSVGILAHWGDVSP
jgi:hypothetical protein